MALNASRKDLAAGGVFVLIGAAFAAESLNYELGTAFRMGPGYMPLVLGGVLVALGAAIALAGLRKGADGAAEPVSWRGIVLILLTLGFFGACIRGLGFLPTVLIGTVLTGLASRESSPLFVLGLAVALTTICVVVFKFGLGLTVPMFGPWLGALGGR